MKRAFPVALLLGVFLASTAFAAKLPRLEILALRPGVKDKPAAASGTRIAQIENASSSEQVAKFVADVGYDGVRFELPGRSLTGADEQRIAVDHACRLIGTKGKTSVAKDGQVAGECMNGWTVTVSPAK